MKENLGDFLGDMMRTLDRNNFKHGWNNMNLEKCLTRIRQETKEAANRVKDKKYEDAAREAIDIANFAYFLWYNSKVKIRESKVTAM